jgi:hypothetical protein
MTKPKKPAAKPPRPRQGGSFIRDAATGRLTPEKATAPVTPPLGGNQKQES